MNDKSNIRIAHRLKEVRLQKSLTQVDVAAKAGLSPNYYARLERAEVTPTVETLEKIIKALGVKSSEILPF